MPVAVGVMADSYNAPASGGATPPVAGYVGWYDAADAASFTYSSGTVVSQWADKSGNARHFTQATVGFQPSRSGTQNGKAAVVFDGVDDYMDTAAFTVAQPLTICIACKPTAKATFGFVSSVGGNLQSYSGASSRLDWFCGTNLQLAATALHDTAVTLTFTASSTGFIYKNNIQVTTGAVGANGTTTGLRLCSDRNLTASYRLSGPVFEVIVYPKVLDTPERQQVESYLKAKWGTP